MAIVHINFKMVVVTVAICWWTFWTACWVVIIVPNFITFYHRMVVGSGVVLHLAHCSFNLLGYDQVSYFSWHWFMPWIWRVHIHLKEKRSSYNISSCSKMSTFKKDRGLLFIALATSSPSTLTMKTNRFNLLSTDCSTSIRVHLLRSVRTIYSSMHMLLCFTCLILVAYL